MMNHVSLGQNRVQGGWVKHFLMEDMGRWSGSQNASDQLFALALSGFLT